MHLPQPYDFRARRRLAGRLAVRRRRPSASAEAEHEPLYTAAIIEELEAVVRPGAGLDEVGRRVRLAPGFGADGITVGLVGGVNPAARGAGKPSRDVGTWHERDAAFALQLVVHI